MRLKMFDDQDSVLQLNLKIEFLITFSGNKKALKITL